MRSETSIFGSRWFVVLEQIPVFLRVDRSSVDLAGVLVVFYNNSVCFCEFRVEIVYVAALFGK